MAKASSIPSSSWLGKWEDIMTKDREGILASVLAWGLLLPVGRRFSN
jgi:hypothetical protein